MAAIARKYLGPVHSIAECGTPTPSVGGCGAYLGRSGTNGRSFLCVNSFWKNLPIYIKIKMMYCVFDHSGSTDQSDSTPPGVGWVPVAWFSVSEVAEESCRRSSTVVSQQRYGPVAGCASGATPAWPTQWHSSCGRRCASTPAASKCCWTSPRTTHCSPRSAQECVCYPLAPGVVGGGCRPPPRTRPPAQG